MHNLVIGKTEYERIHKIADGGMGSVYKVRLKGVAGFEKVVAVKTLLEQFVNDRDFVERFIAEAKLVANLVHENIVQIYQLDRDDNEYFFVLEYVDGISLYDFIEFHCRVHKTLPLPLAVFIASRVARGLAYAHSRRDAANRPLNIVHCDICPHNIMINSEGVPKITDFGIARAVNIENHQRISGKLAFMAPEQAEKDTDLTGAADIYSLGVVLFYLLSTGEYTRDIHTVTPDLLAQVRQNYVAWTRLPENIPAELNAILRKMLATAPTERYTDTAQLASELEYFIYKDGYGPTIVTLAKYMAELMPGKFTLPAPVPVEDKTVIMPPLDDAADRTVVILR